MSFRARLALVAAAAVALAVLTASLVVYFVVRDQLRATVDDSLKTTAAQLQGSPVHDFEHFGTPAGELGLAVARAALAPVRRLTTATERVTETGDLSERIEAGGRDELSRLAGSFNTMLGALQESSRVQRQLVADASHELRTPLTSLRTNIEVLASERELAPRDRQKLLADVVDQLGEMTTLISGLIDLARGEQQTAEPEDVRLDLVTAEAVERTRRYRPAVSFTPDL